MYLRQPQSRIPTRDPKRWRSVLKLGLALVFSLALAPHAKASFVGYYDVNLGNWTLMNSGDPLTDGSAAPANGNGSLVLTGGNDGSGNPGATTFLIAAPTTGFVSFDWVYTSNDSSTPVCGPSFDQICDTGGYRLGSTFTYLADDTSASTTGWSGTVAPFSVTAGQVFGFEVDTSDNTFEPGILTISNFNAPAAVPEPGTAVLLFVGIALTIGTQRWKKRSMK